MIKRKHIAGIIMVMCFAVGIVAALAWVSLRPISQKNGFLRNVRQNELQLANVIPKGSDIIGIAGATEYHIYFKTKDPSVIWQTNYNLNQGKYIRLRTPAMSKLASAFNVVVDSPKVHILAGNVPAVIETDLNGGGVVIFKFPTALFTRAVKISDKSYAFRGFDTTVKQLQQIFIKGNPSIGEIKRQKDENIKFGDEASGIITDGHLNYDNKTHSLAYVSYYTNTLLCLDTNLNLKYRASTIDTITSIDIKTGAQKQTITATTPVRVVNSKSKVSEGKLYNISKLIADNESISSFNENAVIDIYNLTNGQYEKSYYVPLYKRDKIVDFRKTGAGFIVVYKTHIATFIHPR